MLYSDLYHYLCNRAYRVSMFVWNWYDWFNDVNLGLCDSSKEVYIREHGEAYELYFPSKKYELYIGKFPNGNLKIIAREGLVNLDTVTFTGDIAHPKFKKYCKPSGYWDDNVSGISENDKVLKGLEEILENIFYCE